MNHEGPPLETLLRRLAGTPGEFLAVPRIAGRGAVQVDAVVADLLRSFGQAPEPALLTPFRAASQKDRNRLSVALLLSWLLADDWFRAGGAPAAALLSVITEAAAELAPATAAEVFTRDPDRREEMARLTLARLDFRPAGETVAQAQDRLKSISAAERARVIKAARAAEERARSIREALAKKAAEESADKYTRE
jgi:hypothetical protein